MLHCVSQSVYYIFQETTILIHEKVGKCSIYFFSDAFQKGLQILEELQVPFDLGINHTILKHVPKLAKKFPDLKMVIDHLAKPEVPKGEESLRAFKNEISEVAKFPNIFMKLSGLVVLLGYMVEEPWTSEMFQPYVEHCIKEFGSKR